MKKYGIPVCLFLSCLLVFAGCAQARAGDSSAGADSHSTTKSVADAATSTTKKPANLIPQPSDTDPTTTTEPPASTTTSTKADTNTTKIPQEERHTAITMTLDKQAYAPDEMIRVTVNNGTEDEISYGPQFLILKPGDNGAYQILHNTYGWNAILYQVSKGSSKTDIVKLTHYQVENNQAYKIALNIDGKWAIADFRISDK